MTEDILFFFDKRKDALPLYETLESRIFREIENVRVKVQKSQISFYNRHLFACVSFAGLRKKKDCPESYIGAPEEIDDELMAWIKSAADFSEKK